MNPLTLRHPNAFTILLLSVLPTVAAMALWLLASDPTGIMVLAALAVLHWTVLNRPQEEDEDHELAHWSS